MKQILDLNIMSGHSKWAKVKHQKATNDPKRGKAFSKLNNLITVAARDGSDPATNPKLRVAIEKAKELAMPKANIERAIKRGSGESDDGKKLEEMFLEAYGPGGVAILIHTITDNKNRTLAELRHLLQNHQAKMANEGSVRWLFKEVAQIIIPKEKWNDDLYLKTIEQGAEAIKEEGDEVIIYSPLQKLSSLKNFIEQYLPNVKIQDKIDWISDQNIAVPDQGTKTRLESLFDALDESDDVEEIYSNIA